MKEDMLASASASPTTSASAPHLTCRRHADVWWLVLSCVDVWWRDRSHTSTVQGLVAVCLETHNTPDVSGDVSQNILKMQLLQVWCISKYIEKASVVSLGGLWLDSRVSCVCTVTCTSITSSPLLEVKLNTTTTNEICWRMPKPSEVCWRMPKYVDVCRLFLLNKRRAVCWRMLTYVDVCWRVLTYAGIAVRA
jgi:hypothetical protein